MKVLNTVIEIMRKANELEELKMGYQKKKYVMETVRDILHLPDEVEDVIIEFIDIVIDVEKGRIKINEKVKRLFIFPCFICHKNK
jgi:hypothetical protein